MDDWVELRTGVRPTPPPAVRRSTRSVLDPETRPSGAEPDPSVTFGPRGRAVANHLLEVHGHHRAEIDHVRDVVGQVRAGVAAIGAARSAVNDMAVRANSWTLGGICQAQCLALTQHHTMETGQVFPHLVAEQPDLAPVVERLDAEHHLIHGVLEELDAALVHLVQHPSDLDPLEAALDLLEDTLLSHFAYEERELVAPLARHGFFLDQV
ncbi:hemerythrin domain-containing protein [Nocardioides dongxiaopingii]|uniref:hemerythrin domain-containing protein n=1 Tax=Nocardioides sp. S-1144 TaxID=2582905 RepID=UPI001651F6B1|nr:hemerythrin domain-containing protein [Nocardioides sp. S-1144]